MYEYQDVPYKKVFKKYFRRLDFYAKPITLRHKGEYKFYTNAGAYTSFLILLIIVSYATYLLSIVVSKCEALILRRNAVRHPNLHIVEVEYRRLRFG